jgi:methylated-DNA-protein-cysteine methyltransferase-like protein
MPRVDADFKDQVYALVKQIPKGRVASYGQIAAICGAAWAAWEVGQIAHLGPPALPWHRVVNKAGGLASGFVPGGRDAQKKLLEGEDIKFIDQCNVDMEQYLWRPNLKSSR